MSSHELPDRALTERQLRAELGDVLDQLQAVPSDAFAQRSKLRDRQVELVQMLREIGVAGAEDIKNRWSELAGHKTPEREKGKPFIPSPIDSGGSG